MQDRIIRRMPGTDPVFGGERPLRCAFTGHRPHKLFFPGVQSDMNELRARLREMIRMLIWEGYSHFISGGAQGVDLMAAELVLELRAQYPWIGLELAVPYEGQSARWGWQDQARYEAVMAQADIVTYVRHSYSREALFERNRYMVDQADLLVAAFNGRPGGTAMTIDYARRRGVPVTCVEASQRAELHRPAMAFSA